MIDEKKLIMAIANWQQTLKPGWSSANDTDTVICNTLEEVVGLIESQPPADVPDTNVGEWIPCSEAVDIGYLYDWYIASVMDDEPVWTEKHIEELFNDFILIPKPLPEPYKGE